MYYLYSVPAQKFVKPAGCENVRKSLNKERQIQILVGNVYAKFLNNDREI